MTLKDTRPHLALTLAFVALWAAEEALTALVLGRYGLTQVVWLRFVMHVLMLLLVWGWRDPAALWRTRRPLLQLARAGLMVGVPVFWGLGMRAGIEPATQMSTFWLAPLMILALGHVALGERVARAVWLATAVASIGVFTLTGPHEVPRPHLLVLPLGMALCFSGFVVMTRALREERVWTNLFYVGLGVVVMLSPLMLGRWTPPTGRDWLIHLGIALLGLGSLWALERLAARRPVSRSAPLVYLQIPFAVAIGWNLEEYPSLLRVAAGLGAIGAAAIFVWTHERRRAGRLAVDTGLGSLEDTRP